MLVSFGEVKCFVRPSALKLQRPFAELRPQYVGGVLTPVRTLLEIAKFRFGNWR